jgi:unsaturated rhamnogalacturonyl hydrolase
MKFKTLKILSITAFASGLFLACAQTKTANVSKSSTETSKAGKVVPTNLKWSERMLLSEMHRFPEAWMLDFSKSPKWTYPSAIVLDGAEKVYAKTGKKEYYDYISGFGEKLITEDGTILTYELDKYNIDMLNSGNVLLYLYEKHCKHCGLRSMECQGLQKADSGTKKSIQTKCGWTDFIWVSLFMLITQRILQKVQMLKKPTAILSINLI